MVLPTDKLTQEAGEEAISWHSNRKSAHEDSTETDLTEVSTPFHHVLKKKKRFLSGVAHFRKPAINLKNLMY